MRVVPDIPAQASAMSLVTLRRRSGPPYRVRAGLVARHRLIRPGSSEIALSLWNRNGRGLAVSLEGEAASARLEAAALCDTLEAAMAFAEAESPGAETAAEEVAGPIVARQIRQALDLLVGAALSDWCELAAAPNDAPANRRRAS